MDDDRPAVLNRVRVQDPKRKGRFYFGVLVPPTRGTVILDGHAARIIQVDPIDVEHRA